MLANDSFLKSSMIALFVSVTLASDANAVDGVIEINQARANAGGVTSADTAGWPVTINASGSYRLTSNLTLPNGNTNGIEITASSVSIDLNGFSIVCGGCTSGSGVGIGSGAGIEAVQVVNGTIVDMGHDGINLPGARNHVDRVRVIGFDSLIGIVLGSDCLLTNSNVGNGDAGGTVGARCTVRNVIGEGTNAVGLSGGDFVTVVDSTFSNNGGGAGLSLGQGASVLNVTANNNTDEGITVGASSTVTGSRANNNSGAGIEMVSGTVTSNVANSNGIGIALSGNGTVLSNTALSNSGVGLSTSAGSGYGSNVFNLNNGGNANPQVTGGIQIGTNVCGGNTSCP